MPDARRFVLAAALLSLPAGAVAQGPLAPPALRVLDQAREPDALLAECRSTLVRDAADYEANWRAAGAWIALGKRFPDDAPDPGRLAAYREAEAYARRAIAARPDGADGHFMLAQAIARGSLGRSRRERVAVAEEIRREALRAIALDPRHDGAYHVLGRWHAQIMRLSGLQRLVARRLLGGGSFGEASWAGAVQNLETAVGLAPRSITHRLALAEVLVECGRAADAGVHVDTALALPAVDLRDPAYQARAAALRTRLAEGSR
jgi:tetratricopeptide (TPR) repeat protein